MVGRFREEGVSWSTGSACGGGGDERSSEEGWRRRWLARQRVGEERGLGEERTNDWGFFPFVRPGKRIRLGRIWMA